MTIKAFGAHAADKKLEPLNIERRPPGPHDVQIEIAYCGVCHSDIHTVRAEWEGTLCLVGAPGHPTPNVMNLIFGRRAIAGSLIGGLAETQEMLDFCAERAIVSDIEMIPAQKIDEAYDRMGVRFLPAPRAMIRVRRLASAPSRSSPPRGRDDRQRCAVIR